MDSISMDVRPRPVTGIEVGIVILRDGLSIAHWNDTVVTWTGRAADDVVGQPLHSVLANVPGSWIAKLQDLLDGGAPTTLTGASPLAPAGGDPARMVVTATSIESAAGSLAMVTLVDPLALATQDNGEVPEIRERLAELGMLDEPDFLKDSVVEFVDTTTALLAQLSEAIAAGDRPGIVAHAHRLAGSAVTLGAQQMGHLASAIENNAEATQGSLEDRLATLRRESERVHAFCWQLVG